MPSEAALPDGAGADADAMAILRLMNLPGVGEAAIHRILQRLAEREIAIRFLPELAADELMAWELLSAEATELLLSEDQRTWIASVREELDRQDIRLVPITSPAYPEHMRQKGAALAPPLLMVAGQMALLRRGGTAVAGSRDVSDRGAVATREIVADTVAHEFPVIAGGARGVDSIAHEAALACGGVTVVVLAEGILSPRAQAMIEDLRGTEATVLSAFLPNQSWQAWSAMQRNRHILGLCDRLIVIEAKARGGTIAAGREALKREVPTWVLDGPEPDEIAAGNRALIADGAGRIPVEADGTLAIPRELRAVAGWLVKPVR